MENAFLQTMPPTRADFLTKMASCQRRPLTKGGLLCQGACSQASWQRRPQCLAGSRSCWLLVHMMLLHMMSSARHRSCQVAGHQLPCWLPSQQELQSCMHVVTLLSRDSWRSDVLLLYVVKHSCVHWFAVLRHGLLRDVSHAISMVHHVCGWQVCFDRRHSDLGVVHVLCLLAWKELFS
jgi:hypothetical protein